MRLPSAELTAFLRGEVDARDFRHADHVRMAFEVPPVGLDPQQARPRRPALHRPARPLRHHPDRPADHAGSFAAARAHAPKESVISVTARWSRARRHGQPEPATGEIELDVAPATSVLAPPSRCRCRSSGEDHYPEEMRLKYRFLDLRRAKLHSNIMLRAKVIASIRRRMIELGFTEFQTPILTASSPEGARDFLVPSRCTPAKFYALPQAPQQFKQLLMVSGFDRYFQIAPCFRDEDGRADRSPGEFYQLDVEMSFVTQEDVFAAIEPVMHGVFEEFAEGRAVTPRRRSRASLREAMLEYGSDKPDLRNPLVMPT
jgi:aspartyl-tRNA synthetase